MCQDKINDVIISKKRVFWKTLFEISQSKINGDSNSALNSVLTVFPKSFKSGDDLGWQPLHFACACKDIDVEDAKVLASEAAKSSHFSGNEEILLNPCHILCMQLNPSIEIFKVIKSNIHQISQLTSSSKELPLHVAAEFSGNFDFVRELYHDYPEGLKKLDKNGNSVLHCAMRNSTEQSHQIQDFILQSDLSAIRIQNSDGNTALNYSLILENDNNLEIIEKVFMLDPSLSLIQNKFGNSPLHNIMMRKLYVTLQDWVFNNNVNLGFLVNSNGFSPFHSLILSYDGAIPDNVLKIIVQHDSNFFKRSTINKCTPLHLACSNMELSFENIVYIYDQCKEAINLFDGERETPLYGLLDFRPLEEFDSFVNLYPVVLTSHQNCPHNLFNFAISNRLYEKAMLLFNHPLFQLKVGLMPQTMSLLSLNWIQSFSECSVIHKKYPKLIQAIDENGNTALHLLFSARESDVEDDEDFTIESTGTLACAFRYILARFPEAASIRNFDCKVPYQMLQELPQEVKNHHDYPYYLRVLLKAYPAADEAKFKSLNYECRRTALYLFYSAIFGDSKKGLIFALIGRGGNDPSSISRRVIEFL